MLLRLPCSGVGTGLIPRKRVTASSRNTCRYETGVGGYGEDHGCAVGEFDGLLDSAFAEAAFADQVGALVVGERGGGEFGCSLGAAVDEDGEWRVGDEFSGVGGEGLGGDFLSAERGQGALFQEEIGEALALGFVAGGDVAQVEHDFGVAVLGHGLEAERRYRAHAREAVRTTGLR